MKSFQRIKNVHGKQYLYEITPYYDREKKKIRQRSRYIAPMKDGKPVERYAVTYTYGDLLPVIKAARDLKLPDILKKIAGEYADILLTMAINRIIRPEAMDLVSEWYEDSYISTIYSADLSSATLSRAMTALGKMNLNHAFLNEIIKATGIKGALYYDLDPLHHELEHYNNIMECKCRSRIAQNPPHSLTSTWGIMIWHLHTMKNLNSIFSGVEEK